MYKILLKIFICVLPVFFLCSCISNVTDILIQGIVTDKDSNPVSDAEVTVSCKINLGFLNEEEYYNKIKIRTDGQGYFSCKFEKGFELNITVKANGYNTKTVFINKLRKNNIIKTNITLENDLFQNYNAIIYRNPDLKLSIKKRQINDDLIIEKWGVNVVTGENKDTTEATVWLQNDGYLVVQHGGGIIPIFNTTKKQKQNLLYEYVEAPFNDYKQIHKITGQEGGYFIKTKENMYAKLILSGSYETIGSDNGVIYTETGYIIKVIYQPDSSNILNVTQSIDLE